MSQLVDSARKFVNSKPRAVRVKSMAEYRGYPVLIDGWMPVLNGEYVFVDTDRYYGTKAEARKAGYRFRDKCRELVKAAGGAT